MTCTFTNSKYGTITVTKRTVGPDGVTPINAADLFAFGINTNPAQTVQAQGGQTQSFSVPVGTYTVGELGSYINASGTGS